MKAEKISFDPCLERNRGGYWRTQRLPYLRKPGNKTPSLTAGVTVSSLLFHLGQRSDILELECIPGIPRIHVRCTMMLKKQGLPLSSFRFPPNLGSLDTRS